MIPFHNNYFLTWRCSEMYAWQSVRAMPVLAASEHSKLHEAEEREPRDMERTWGTDETR